MPKNNGDQIQVLIKIAVDKQRATRIVDRFIEVCPPRPDVVEENRFMATAANHAHLLYAMEQYNEEEQETHEIDEEVQAEPDHQSQEVPRLEQYVQDAITNEEPPMFLKPRPLGEEQQAAPCRSPDQPEKESKRSRAGESSRARSPSSLLLRKCEGHDHSLSAFDWGKIPTAKKESTQRGLTAESKDGPVVSLRKRKHVTLEPKLNRRKPVVIIRRLESDRNLRYVRTREGGYELFKPVTEPQVVANDSTRRAGGE
jgi:hypothetical protein